MTTRSRTIALAAATVALFAAGCGSDDDEATDESAAPTTEESAATGDAVQIIDFEFTPGDLSVDAGTEVTFTNDDTSPHTATADDDSFDTGKLDDGGDSGSVTLDEPGTYSYFCEFHPTMKGSIEVN
jgi:plastocyanin